MFTAAELTGQRAAQDLHMMDTCYIQVYSASMNSFGEPVAVYTEALTSTACGLDMRPGSERHEADKSTTEWDATIRLPIATSITARDRIRVTARFGEALASPIVFSVAAPIQRGPSGIRLQLKRVEP